MQVEHPQTPSEQLGLVQPGGAHLVPQALQLFGSVLMLTSQPFEARPSQLAKPALQVEITQLPVEQLVEAFGKLHATPQAVQLVLVLSAASQPSDARPLQLP